jgi:signal transduction histidine kinase
VPKKSLRWIPYWAYLLVLLAIFVNTVYFVFTYRSSVIDSDLSYAPVLFWSIYIMMVLFSISSLYLLYKKPHDKAVWLFFIYIQLFIVTMNGVYLDFKDLLAMIATLAFMVLGCFLGPVLFHFNLLFPRPANIIRRHKKIPLFFYLTSTLLAAGSIASYINDWNKGFLFGSFFFNFFNRIGLLWLTMNFILALYTAIYQFKTIKDTLSRNQSRIVIAGTLFNVITGISLGLFYNQIDELVQKFPPLMTILAGISSLIMIICLLIAIFRYRIWDFEVIIRKVLLYIGATLVIILSYLLIIWVVDRLTIRETDFTRFLILGISVIIFLVLRDRLQRLIDRLFHRETYDSATVVSDFEEKLAGIYRSDELMEKIVQELDEIFHFKSFVFNLKINELMYEPAVIIGVNNLKIGKEFDVPPELERKLCKSQVFSPYELVIKPPLFEMADGELIVPLSSGDQPKGFVLCGHKKSERVYSHQDIRVLTLLARRVIALLHTATLYQKDLDRQLMLERERARISQDMHDDIGAGLTKIAMISEAPVKMQDAGYKMQDARYKMQDTADCGLPTVDLMQDRLERIASFSRELISRLNVIVWALNPKYDTLDSLISYLRRYFGEYVENFGIQFKTDLPEQVPELSITPDTRRNIFYSVQEAIHNAVKHSGCSEINLGMKLNQKEIVITITDNGNGFDKVKHGSGGNGLLNMKKRAEDLGGTFEIRSSPGKGTRIVFFVKL